MFASRHKGECQRLRLACISAESRQRSKFLHEKSIEICIFNVHSYSNNYIVTRLLNIYVLV